MHLSGYDPLAYCFIVNLTWMHFVICKLNSSLGASSSKVLTGKLSENLVTFVAISFY